MTNLLDRFNKSAVGSRGRIADYIPKVSSEGDFMRRVDINVILASWSNILLTPRHSYQFDPQYGSDLYKLVFDPADNSTASRIKDEVVTSLMTHDDRAKITDVKITFLTNLKGFKVDLIVDYKKEISNLEVIINENMFSNAMEITSE